jgi:hypothetical protein
MRFETDGVGRAREVGVRLRNHLLSVGAEPRTISCMRSWRTGASEGTVPSTKSVPGQPGAEPDAFPPTAMPDSNPCNVSRS